MRRNSAGPHHLCRGGALPRPTAPIGAAIQRGRHVSPDTQRRPAGRPSPRSPGRERPGSVPKPADPHGASTQPIDPGACAPHSPLQGACGLSPGLQPRAFAADRPGSAGRGTTAPLGVDRPALRAGGSGTAWPLQHVGRHPNPARVCLTNDIHPLWRGKALLPSLRSFAPLSAEW